LRTAQNALAGRVFEVPNLDSTVLLLVTAQFISELLIKLSTVF